MRFLSMAALALVGAVTVGCSSDDNFIDEPQQPENKSNVVTLTTTVSMDGGAAEARATTRALTAGGAKTFAAGETMALVYKNTSSATVKVVSTALTDGDITNAGKSATFTFELTDPDRTQNVTYIYPAAMANADGSVNYDALATQNGTLTTLSSSLDLATKTSAWDAGSLPTATLENQLAILALTLKDNATPTANDITSTITGVTLSDGTNSYAVTRTAAAGPIYVAIQPTTSANITVTATDGTTNYSKSLTGKTYAASNGYSLNWRMAVAARTLAEATAEDLGKIAGADGNIYDDAAAATSAGTTALAMIAYVGSDAETSTTYNHGLALALSDVSGNQKWCSQYSATCLSSQYGDASAAKGDMAGIANTDALVGHGSHTHAAAAAARGYNSGTHPTGTSEWFLPSAGQWDKMATAVGGYAILKTFAGLKSDSDTYYFYWSSSESEAKYAWRFRSDDGAWYRAYKDNVYLVRACLAF